VVGGVRIGSLFSGYGGLDMAVQSVYGGALAWYSEIEPAACTVLAAHHPGVPNLGDITVVDWADVEPVDILTGGYPCQPFSHAGQRKGTNDERHLYPFVSAAIGALRPGLVVLENVAGHRSLGLADVLLDLAALGYDVRWGSLRAADAGAPHGRERVFIVAYPAGAHGDGHGRVDDAPQAGRGLRPGVAGHPLPAADAQDQRHERSGGTRGRGAGSTDNSVAAADAKGVRGGALGAHVDQTRGTDGPSGSGERATDWGKYAPAIERWQRVIGRPAPQPTTPGAKGLPRLSPLFVEWLMGLPEGHVTGHGLTRTAELKMLGNGVVPQQAALALRMLAVAP
jgi:DNA (cytosine-5)-methyltransferase 1